MDIVTFPPVLVVLYKNFKSIYPHLVFKKSKDLFPKTSKKKDVRKEKEVNKDEKIVEDKKISEDKKDKEIGENEKNEDKKDKKKKKRRKEEVTEKQQNQYNVKLSVKKLRREFLQIDLNISIKYTLMNVVMKKENMNMYWIFAFNKFTDEKNLLTKINNIFKDDSTPQLLVYVRDDV
ncbi:MAG: hypothetical protein LBT82_01170 [Oscillospiraceae bacterium]|jgi:hypothetical protein|nr:hypothetical protein [Oscillospiraceae bacterium]